MARPRREAGIPEGRERLIAAFWSLLKTRELASITVGALSEEAGCNRGTFYYHFDSLDALIQAAIEAEILTERTFSHSVLETMISDEGDSANSTWKEHHFDHIELLIKRGGLELANAATKSVVIALWTNALHPEGGELSPQTRYILEYSMSGVLGMITFAHSDDSQMMRYFPTDFARRVARFILTEISAVEGISVEEIAHRLRSQAAQ